MAIPMSEIRSRFIRYTPGATLSRDNRLRFMNYEEERRYGRVNIGQQGYNAASPSIRVQTVRLNRDVVIPRVR